ncbi:phytanoyl-CoA dioxygenase family protein [Chitinophaga sp. MM2321]|uniref:phytanoyl-CoA dioxygenase family protein n=1 Tax=Chitinophaga sp. MM2321 TaxID=3137178 RepID=UPI0032D573C2
MNNNTTTLPDLNNFINISDDQTQQFSRDGHIFIPGILSKEEVAAYRDVIVEAADKYNSETRKLADRDTYGKAFLQIMNLWRNDERVKKFILAKRFGKIAADLLGVKNVRIYHDQALFKEPGGGPTPWHQDQNYWPLDTNKTITMWMPLVDLADADMGMLTFASGSQIKGNVFDHVISDESEDAFDNYVKDNGFAISRPSSMKAGDATWHHGYTIHNAPGNTSQTRREVITIIYYADGATISQPKHKWQENDLEKWLLGKAVGTLADSELNPTIL